MKDLSNFVEKSSSTLDNVVNIKEKPAVETIKLLVSQAVIGALFGGIVGVVYASLGWAIFMSLLGAATAISVEVVDRVFYHQRLAADGNPKIAAAASVIVCWLLGLAIIGVLMLWITA